MADYKDSQDYDSKMDASTNASSSSNPKTPRSCARCQNHQKKIALKGHRRYCMYRTCKCEKCQLISERQRVMKMQTARRRAEAQDEAMLRNGHLDISMLPSIPNKTLSPILTTDRGSLDCVCKCEKCQLTSERQRVMKMQTAFRKAQAQDEAMLRNGHLDFSMLPSIPNKTLSPILTTDRGSLDCVCKCENCQLTSERQRVMKMQTAFQRAKAQDEAMLRNGHLDIFMLPSIPNETLSPILTTDRGSLDCVCKCEKCQLTSERQRVMKMQTAFQRAQVQDEAMLRNGHLDISMLPSIPNETLSPILTTDRGSLDCDSSASSPCANPPSASRKVSPVLAVPATGTSMPIGISNDMHPYKYKALKMANIEETAEASDKPVELPEDESTDGVLVMNFWEEGDEFPQPTQVKEEEYAEEEFEGNTQSSNTCESTIKEENSSYVIDMREHFYANEGTTGEFSKEEFILGAEETDIIAIARQASEKDEDEDTADENNETDIIAIARQASEKDEDEDTADENNETDIIAIARQSSEKDEDKEDENNEQNEEDGVKRGEELDKDTRSKENETTKNQTTTDPNVITLDSDSEDDSTVMASNHPIVDKTPNLKNTTYSEKSTDNNTTTFMTTSTVLPNITTAVNQQTPDQGSNLTNLIEFIEVKSECSTESLPTNIVESNFKFNCEICSFSAKTRFALSRHKELHTHSKLPIELEPTPTHLVKQLEEAIIHGVKHTNSNVPLESERIPISPAKEESKIATQIFKCAKCSFSSKIRFALKRHSSIHINVPKKHENIGSGKQSSNLETIQSGFKCIYCSYVAKSKSGTINHIRFKHGTKIKQVNQNYKVPAKKDKSDLPKTTESMFQCHYCSYKSPLVSNLERHLLLHTKYNKPIFNCKKCDFKSTQNVLDRHVNKAHKKADVQPIFVKRKLNRTGAQKELDFSKKLINDDQKHIPEKNIKGDSRGMIYVCEMCDFITNIKETLIDHNRSHTNDVSERDAEKSLRLKLETERIETTAKPQRENKMSKNITSRYFCDSRKIEGVILVDNRRKCRTCKQIFKDIRGFTAHKCDFMTDLLKFVSFKNSLYKCKQCLYSTNNKYNMKRHLVVTKKHGRSLNNTLLNKSTYDCDQCNFKTHQSGLLKTHKLLCHKKRLKCDLCGFVTMFSWGMTNHKKHKHPTDDDRVEETSPKNKYKCDACDFQTDYERNLLNHKVLHININGLRVYKNKTFNVSINQNNSDKEPSTSTSEKSQDNELQTHKLPLKLEHTPTHLVKDLEEANTRAKEESTKATHRFKCTKCSFSSKIRFALKRHILTHLNIPKKHENLISVKQSTILKSKGRFKCTYCSHVAKSKTGTINHIRFKHGIKIKQVNQNYKVPAKKDKSVLAKTTKPVLQCQYCSYKSAFHTNFNNHLLLHTKYNKPINSCKKCDFKSTTHVLWRHVNQAHKKADVQPVCVQRKLNSTDAQKELDFPKELVNDDQKHIPEKNIKDNSSGLVYVCEICDFITSIKETLIDHKRSHSNDVSETDTKKFLKVKLKTEQTEITVKPKSEKEMSQINTSKYFYDSRKKQGVILGNNKRQCCACKQIFGGMVAFTVHKCDFVTEFFKLVSLKGSLYKCKKCSHSTKHKYNMKTHLKLHRKGKSYDCEKCNFKTPDGRLSRKHKIMCHTQPLKCDVCGFVTMFSWGMTNHKKHKHPTDDGRVEETSPKNKYKCDACDFQTDYELNLLNHKVLHININELRVYKNKTYNVNINHNDSDYEPTTSTSKKIPKKEVKSKKTKTYYGKIFSCDSCSYTTHRSDCLFHHKRNLHLRPYKGKWYRCDSCKYKSLIPEYLNTHKRKKHSIGNQYKDIVSNINSASVLKKSIEGVQFTCPHCSYKSNSRFGLKIHINKKHVKVNKKTIFKCDICSFTFANKYCLDRHIVRRHTDKSLKDDNKKDSSENIKKSTGTLFNCGSCFYVSKHKCNLDKHFNMCHVKK